MGDRYYDPRLSRQLDYRAKAKLAAVSAEVQSFLDIPNGRGLRETWDDLDMTLKSETYARVMKDGFRMERTHEIPAKGGEGLLRVVVYDMANDRIGSAEAKLKRR